MARASGPLMSLGASGTLASTLVFSTWKGRPYVRQRVIPSNPRSGLQTAFRAMMKFLSQAWAALSDPDKATWSELAAADAISTFNAYVRGNQQRFAQAQAPSMATPATEATTPNTVAGTVGTGGVRTATVDVTPAGGATPWACIIRRSTASPVLETQDNIIGVTDNVVGGANRWIDSPLTPGTYYYSGQFFTDDGALGAMGATSAAVVVS